MWIRPMEKADTAAICKLEGQCFSDPWTDKMIDDMYENDFDETYVAEEKGSIVGYVNVRTLGDEAELMRICVADDFRGCGIGKLLMKRGLIAAEVNEAKKVMLEVRESNGAAIALYKGSGFTEIARREAYYSNPDEAAIVMVKED